MSLERSFCVFVNLSVRSYAYTVATAVFCVRSVFCACVECECNVQLCQCEGLVPISVVGFKAVAENRIQ